MAKKIKDVKTNVMRLLDQAGVSYVSNYYSVEDGRTDGLSVAEKIGQDPTQVYKTLVCQGHSKSFYVFVIPVGATLHFKKAAAVSGEKAIAMIPQRILLPTTGYVHGGCSPLGMKKKFSTFIDSSAEHLPIMYVSAGKVGAQVGLSSEDLSRLADAQFKDLI